MFSVGYPELMVVLGLALIVFGPKKLPQIGRTLGETLREFRRTSNQLMATIREPLDDEDEKKEGDV